MIRCYLEGGVIDLSDVRHVDDECDDPSAGKVVRAHRFVQTIPHHFRTGKVETAVEAQHNLLGVHAHRLITQQKQKLLQYIDE